MKPFKKNNYVPFALLLLVIGHIGCTKKLLDQQPLAQLSEATFWHSQSDALLALTGIYQGSDVGDASYTNDDLILGSDTDDSGYKNGGIGVIYSGYLLPSDGQVVGPIWTRAYKTIFRANYFLQNIDKVTMDATLKAQYIAEVKFLRAYEYFYMSVLYGGVPLVTKTLTIPEANSQTRNSLQEVQDFAISECTAAAADLPALRPDGEKGRILKGAALGIKGRLLMIQKKWPEAAATYKAIIDLNSYIIDPRYKEIFEEVGENSKENLLVVNCVAGLYGNTHNQRNYHPDFYGGYQEDNIFQNLVDAYQMTDGLSISQSPLYDPKNPFKNRDPRLYATIFLPGYTVFRGQLFPADPVATKISSLKGATGYGWKKFVTENFTGDNGSSGDDIILMRYAEVLLSYLESKLESGDAITQDLLDQTINKVRSRAAVNMPPVTETNAAKLREILRNEVRVEFATERLIRYMTIRRWGIYQQVINKVFYGMKLTDDPANYTTYNVAKSGPYAGHLIVIDKTGTIKPGWDLIPIPLPEIDLNSALTQNPDY
ncbi:MAG: RagB/SusD family nutrient uptake outer membrane protein [Ginsengibacter sp.]